MAAMTPSTAKTMLPMMIPDSLLMVVIIMASVYQPKSIGFLIVEESEAE